MKTGRLLKFRRPGGEVHVYLYKEGGQYRASVYLFSGSGADTAPLHVLTGAQEPALEQDVRDWVDAHFPAAR